MTTDQTTAPPPNPWRKIPIEFRATAGEYFGIWIVNFLLNIVTLGFFSPWAKVRKNQYFYGHTSIEGATFQYTGDPKRILIGRLILGVWVVAYSLTARFSPEWALAVLGVLILAGPFLYVSAIRFRLANTVFRGLRFGFPKAYGESYSLTAKSLLVTVFTLGLGTPIAQFWRAKFTLDRTSYGRVRSVFHGQISDYYRIYGIAIAMYLGAIAIAGGLMFVGYFLFPKEGGRMNPLAVYPVIFVIYLGMGLIGAWVRARLYNLVWNKTALGSIRFESQMSPLGYAWIMVSTGIAVVLSLGFAMPWATVRLARFHMDALTIWAQGVAGSDPFIEFTQADAATPGAIGDAGTDLWDVDFGF